MDSEHVAPKRVDSPVAVDRWKAVFRGTKGTDPGTVVEMQEPRRARRVRAARTVMAL
jgi:hypothetical protein